MTRRDFLSGAVALSLRRDRIDAAALIEQATRDGRVSAAVLRVERGDHQISRAFGRAHRASTPFLLASITKPMTATCVMVLSDRKALAISDPVRKFIPEFSGRGATLLRSGTC
jgi:CubicO group peptidase (beta-lactamase class C family)